MSSQNTNLEKMQKAKLFIATPMYGGMCHGIYTKGLADLFALCEKCKIQVQLCTLFQESLIQRARNVCADEFMRSSATHLLFIDADIGFKAEDVLTLLAFSVADEKDQYDVLAAPYPKKSIDWSKIKKSANSSEEIDLPKCGNSFAFNPINLGTFSFQGNTPKEVADAGTGFMLIPKRTLEKHQKAYPENWYKPYESFLPNQENKRIHAYFDSGIDPETKLYLAEDYLFCSSIRKLGGRIWILPWICLTHAGQYLYTGSLKESAQLNKS